MADVVLNCPHCGEGTTVSEYADVSQLTCGSCGNPMQVPNLRTEAKSRPTITRRKPFEASDEVEEDPDAPNTVVAARENMKQTKKRGSETFRFALYAWLLFLVIGAISWFIRHSDIGTENSIITGGLFLCGCLNVAIVLLAFKDDVFQGMLCLFIPGYFGYYLLFVSDSFLVRGLIAGVFVGFGYDYGLWLFENIAGFLTNFSTFVNTGGGAV